MLLPTVKYLPLQWKLSLTLLHNGVYLGRAVKVDNSESRGSGFDSRVSQKLFFHVFDWCSRITSNAVWSRGLIIVMIYASMACLTLNRLQKSDGQKCSVHKMTRRDAFGIQLRNLSLSLSLSLSLTMTQCWNFNSKISVWGYLILIGLFFESHNEL